jgi:hypothetical protein
MEFMEELSKKVREVEEIRNRTIEMEINSFLGESI